MLWHLSSSLNLLFSNYTPYSATFSPSTVTTHSRTLSLLPTLFMRLPPSLNCMVPLTLLLLTVLWMGKFCCCLLNHSMWTCCLVSQNFRWSRDFLLPNSNFYHFLLSFSDVEAADAAASTTVVSNNNSSNKVTSIDAFYDAYYCLGMRSDPLMQKGIQAALDLQRVSY